MGIETLNPIWHGFLHSLPFSSSQFDISNLVKTEFDKRRASITLFPDTTKAFDRTNDSHAPRVSLNPLLGWLSIYVSPKMSCCSVGIHTRPDLTGSGKCSRSALIFIVCEGYLKCCWLGTRSLFADHMKIVNKFKPSTINYVGDNTAASKAVGTTTV